MEITAANSNWLTQMNLTHPLVIAGPCSAETEAQVLQIARELKNSDVSIFRAGIWKPRTRPGGFEGVGAIGLKWLQKAKAETGLLMAVEVANAAHVKLALEHDIDVLWIGARTTVNPFAVQEIADALQNTDKIVLVKNPVNPDLSLWIGGVERLYGAGIKNLGVIHRGFSVYEKTKYRNNPEWQVAIDLQNRFPLLPLICDPSHITGRRDMIQEVSQQALDLNYDGLIIETHNDPDNAWSDAAQQITPEVLAEMISNLQVRNSDISGYEDEMGKHRTLISDMDFQLIELLSQRMKVSEKIGKLKKENNIAIFQPERWKVITEYATQKAFETGMSQEFIEKVFKAIHEESIEVQNHIMIDK